MGIKDNFSQAVKELWKKEGQEKKDGNNKQPSELDRYLRGDSGEQGSAAPSGVEVNSEGVPLETPYYRNVNDNNPSNTPTGQQTQPAQEQPAQQAQPMQAVQPTAASEQPNRNAQNAQARPEPQNNAGGNNRGFGEDNARSQYGGDQPYNQNVQNARRDFGPNQQNGAGNYGGGYDDRGGFGNQGGYGSYGGGFGGGNPPMNGAPAQDRNETDEITVISKNTIIDGNIRSLANMQIDGNIKGNVETTRNIDMSGKVIGDLTCNNAGMISAAMQGNISLKGRIRMDRDTILIGDLSSQYADINGRVRGKLDITGKAELKRDAVVFGDINASTIAVADGAIIQGYVNTTFLSKEDSRNVFPDAISIDSKEVKS